MSDLKIDKGIPLPSKRSGRKGKWAILAAQMSEGDSVLVDTNIQKACLVQALQAAGHKAVTSKEDGEGFRVWKTEKVEP